MRLTRRLVLILLPAALCGGCFMSGEETIRHPVHPAYRSAGLPGDYTVQRGDTLYSIAFRHQLDYHDLAAWNGIGRDYRIYPGRVLRLQPPGERSTYTPPAANPVPSRAAPTGIAGRSVGPAPPGNSVASDSSVPHQVGNWEWPTRGKVVRGFSPDAGAKGLDIAGDPGQIIVAAAGGKVVYSGSALKGYGELVIIKHDEEYLSAYGYNRRRLVQEGEQVLPGQPIAELGLGPEQKPLLHFEIRDRGKPIDPLPLLPAR